MGEGGGAGRGWALPCRSLSHLSAAGAAPAIPVGQPAPPDACRCTCAVAGPKQLYTVLEQQKANVGTGTLMGSEHTYVIPGAAGQAAGGKEKLSIAAQVRAALRRVVQPEAPPALPLLWLALFMWAWPPNSALSCRNGWRHCDATSPAMWMCPSTLR